LFGYPQDIFLQSDRWDLKINNFVLLVREKGALSAILTERNCAEWPKAALSPIPTERKCAERPEGALSEP